MLFLPYENDIPTLNDIYSYLCRLQLQKPPAYYDIKAYYNKIKREKPKFKIMERALCGRVDLQAKILVIHRSI